MTARPLLFIDSGAYSAKTQGAEISLRQYGAFLKEHKTVIDVAAGLDVLGDPEATLRNHKELLQMNTGAPVIPTYHYGEPLSFLKWYIDSGEPYIALGGLVGRGTFEQQQWLDMVWEQGLTDNRGVPVVKVHGFGLTSVPLMLRYPWFSVDSTSWLMAAATGKVMVFHNGDIVGIAVSEKSPAAEKDSQHISTLPPAMRDAFIQMVEARGFKMEDLAGHYKNRWICNALAYLEFSQSVKPKKFHVAHGSLFAEPKLYPNGPPQGAPAPWAHLAIYLAGAGVGDVTDIIMSRGSNRLISYHYIDGRSVGDWKQARAVRARFQKGTV